MPDILASRYWSFFFFVLQSAAMEETVIWEQHTVTLHRVSVYSSLIHSTLSSHLSFFPSLPVSGILILNYVLCSSLFPLCPLPIHIFSLSTEKASCSSRMCGTETIVKETQMAGNKAKEDRISIHFLTTSFHFLPVWLLNTAPGKERHDSFTLCAFSSCVTCNYDRLY